MQRSSSPGPAIAVSAMSRGLGFYLPLLWLRQLVGDRRKQIESVLPNALDVVAISMEAGLGLDRALSSSSCGTRKAP